MMIDRIVLASPGGLESPSARYRFGPLRDSKEWRLDVVSAGSSPTRTALDALHDLGGEGALLVLHRALPSSTDITRLRRRYRRVIFDFDDAINVVPPNLAGGRIRPLPKRAARLVMRGSPYASARKRPLERILRLVDVCVAGNSVLAGYAFRFARRVLVIPTTVKPISAVPEWRETPPVVVWMGLADNLQYLELVGEALYRLRERHAFTLRVVSTRSWDEAPIPVEFVPWSQDTLRETLESASVGLAPLTDEPWTRGKCAFRAIQYGGHAVPAVASPVGITDKVVIHGHTGYLARTSDDWEAALHSLLTEPNLVERMGGAALQHIQTNYSDAVALEAWRDLIASLDP